jgi:hypothetical protein
VLASSVAQGETVSVACDFAAPQVRRVGELARVTIPGCELMHRVGAPLLPFRTVRVLLPPGSRLDTLAARVMGEPIILPGTGQIEYGRLPIRTPDPKESIATGELADAPDPVIYSANRPFPATRAELASVQRIAGSAVAFIRVYPVQYWPLSGELAYASKLEVEVTATPDRERTEELLPPSRAQSYRAARLRTMVANPSMLQRYETRRLAMESTADFDYLLITKSNLVSAFQPLVELKTQNGVSVKVETVEAILQSQAGRDDPERIRNFIRHAYTNWGITYVLLGGDTAVVPCRYAHVNMGSLVSNPILPCDLYYSCLDGTWNRDNDARWGEPNDGDDGGDVDLLGEVYVGRAPVETVEEVNIFVEKTVRYASQAHPNADRVQVLAEFLGTFSTGPAQGGDMFDPLVPVFNRYQVYWLDDRPFTTPQWTRADALQAMNQSPHLAVFIGHGDDDTLIGANDFLTRSVETADLNLLTNAWPFLACSVGCNVGQFDNDRFSPDCIGEELVKRHRYGAFAAVLNSRLGWYDPQDEAKYSGEFQTRFFEELLAEDDIRLGTAHLLAKQELIGQVESSGIMTYRWCYYETTLLGDPHLAWQAPPETPAVTSQGTPISWLVAYGWTNAFETAALSDTDGDGLAAWQEYVAGTSPVDVQSVLALTVHRSAEGVQLTWPSASQRRYSIWSATDLSAGGFALFINNTPATPPMNVFMDHRQDPNQRFYRIEVERDPEMDGSRHP